jgi:acyl transferase domain-containing protein/acyl carrier protein
MSCRFPGASDVAKFWDMLLSGGSGIGTPSADRAGSDGTLIGRAGYIEQVNEFDAAFFGISPREAAATDPRQRLALELSWEALEHAGLVPGSLASTRTGVFLGVSGDDYLPATNGEGNAYLAVGTNRAMIANRVSHLLDLKGPSLLVDTAQSSSLVAVHLACESIARGESMAALVGGVNLNLSGRRVRMLAELGVISPDRECFTFDARANGFVPGEGGGVVVLKPLSRAEADGDTVHAVIRGTAVNQDGATFGLSSPNAAAQEEVIRAAHRRAGVEPGAITFVELHGTGTRVGDATEASALSAVSAGDPRRTSPLLVGSVKTNIGHLDAAAGVAGLIKTVLSLAHGTLPRSLNYAEPNPDIDLSYLRVAQEPVELPAGDGPPAAGVSSYGMGGTNCHVVVSGPARGAAPATDAVDGEPYGLVPWVVSGCGTVAVRAQAARLGDWVRERPGADALDIASSLVSTRSVFKDRAVVLGAGREALLSGVEAVAEGVSWPGTISGPAVATDGVAWVFPGQGSQWTGMGRALLRESEVFRARLAECDEALSPWVPWSARDVLLANGDAPELDADDVIQPVLFAVMVSLAAVWESWGAVPSAVVGHSQGEIAAACVAGALTVEDAARVVALRSQALRELAGTGGMLAVALAEDDVRRRLAALLADGHVSIAAVNGPGAVVLAGSAAALDASAAALNDVRCRKVPVDYASHTAHVDTIEQTLLDRLVGLQPRQGRVPFYSAVTAAPIDTTTLDNGYWFTNLRRTVRFRDTIEALIRDGRRTFLEVSPHPVLTVDVRATLDVASVPGAVVGSLRRDTDDTERLLTAAAELFVSGTDVDWTKVLTGLGRAGRRVPLPTYAFQRRRHWLDTGPEDAGTTGASSSPAVEPSPEPANDHGEPADHLNGLGEAEQRQFVLDVIGREVAVVLGHTSPADLDLDRVFRDLGFDSLMSADLQTRLSGVTGLRLPTSLIFDYPTPSAVAEFVLGRLLGRDDAGARAPARRAVRDEPLAVVGMACRFPGGITTPAELWRFVADGGDSISGFPTDRDWDLTALRESGGERRGTSHTDQGGFLHDAAGFDAAFFGISPREALAMDPQQRLLLETGWEAIENAGIAPASLRGSGTGVFIGAMPQDYGPRLHEGAQDGDVDGYLLTGTTPSVMSGRIAYVLGFEGPAVSVDTACSSSLVAMHLAGQALRQGECDLALAGGATVMAAPGIFVEFSRQGGLAPDGRCKSFAAAADGTGWSEGVGVLVLERLSDAQRLGHEVLAVVRSSAVNQDGASNGLTAPNGPSQQRVIRQALAAASLSPGDVDTVEAHGTGTRLGDPIEAQALLATYGQDRPADRPLLLGSIKSNIGHTQAAAGVAGVIKMVMALRHRTLPRTLHVDEPTPHVDWSAGAVSLLTENTPWPDIDRPRRAAVSSFGISGTNAHVILEQAPEAETETPRNAGPTGPVPWVLSGRGAAAARAQAARLHAWAAVRPAENAVDIAASLVSMRSPAEDRLVVLGTDRDTLLAGLAAASRGESNDDVIAGPGLNAATGVVFVFPGQGSQWISMGRELWNASAVFRERLAECDAALSTWVSWSVRDVLLGADGAPGLDRVDVVQPTLFAVMVSLAAVWESWGVTPSAVVGHSQGEIAAACAVGALTLPDAAKVVALRSQALRELAGGGMLSVALSEDDAAERLEPWLADGRVSIAAVNGPGSVVLAGDADVLREITAELDGVRCRDIPVDYASHSAQVEPIREILLERISGIEPRPAWVPFYSTVTAGPYDTTGLDAEYWFTNLRRTVRFRGTVEALLRDGHRVFVEVSPHPVLTMGISDTLDTAGETGVVVGSLRRDANDVERMLTAVAELFVAGVDPDWTAVLSGLGMTGRRVPLPTYAFQHQRFWLPARAGRTASPAEDERFWEVVERGDAEELMHTLALPPGSTISAGDWTKIMPALSSWRKERRARSTTDGWRYHVTWKPHAQPPAPALTGAWLVVASQAGDDRADRCAAALTGHGAEAVVVRPGDAAMAGDTDAWRALLADASRDTGAPAGVLSLLGLAQEPHPEHLAVPRGVPALLGLVRALDQADVTAPLWCLTQGAVSVGDTDPLTRPTQALTWGLGRALALEQPRRWGGLVDLPDTPDARGWEHLCGILAAETAEDQFAVRPPGVFVRRLMPAPGGDMRPAGWTPEGTVLVTGGTGAVGAHVARWLAGQGASRLVLLSRSGPDAPGADTLAAELESAGAAVDVVACDITDRTALARVLDDIPAGRPLSAVFHAAGINAEAAVTDLDAASFARVTEAKVGGAGALHELLAERGEPASLVFFSSGAGIWGAGAQAAYAAGNAYLDALAEHRRARGMPATAIAWGAWAEGGMADGEAGRWFDRLGVASMAPELATGVLGDALAAGETALVVADVDWSRFYPTFAIAGPRPLLHDLPDVAGLLSADEAAPSAPEAGFVTELAALSEREQHKKVLELVRTQAAAVLGLADAGGIGADRAFRDIGFDSLTAVDLRERLNRATGLRLPSTAVFNHPTPALLTRHVRELLLGTATGILDTIAKLESELTEISGDQTLMSEVRTRLEKLVGSAPDAQMISADPADVSDLMSTTDDEVFGILRDEFGIS